MKNIAVFYHCLFWLDGPRRLLPASASIVLSQMKAAENSGLLFATQEIMVGVNGADESKPLAYALMPEQAKITFHGLQCRNECRTIRMIEEWLPGHEDWYVLYFHSKGATHAQGDDFTGRWRGCMMRHLISNWNYCIAELDAGYDSIGCHWMTGDQTPPGQSIWAGNFWWAKASFLATLPSIMLRDRIKVSGIDSIESRYESEVWIGNGPKLPNVRDYHGPGWNPSKISTCIP